MLNQIKLRRALVEDAEAIHMAHMSSIKEVCSRDHSPEEISAWGNREFNREKREQHILDQFVYVAEMNGQIKGFMHYQIDQKKSLAYLSGLYLMSEICSKGIGERMLKILFKECIDLNLKEISLSSTLTAHHFYQRFGFVDAGPMTTVQINCVPVRCIPMKFMFR